MKARPSKAITLPKDHFKRKECISIDLEDEDDVIPSHSLNLPDTLRERLYEHQKQGLDWLFRANRESSGAILGDDMGLGKTFQVACLLCGLFKGKEIQRVLIVSPVSVIQSWFREITDHIKPFVSNIGVNLVTSDLSKKKRGKLLSDMFNTNQRSVAITSYNLLSIMIEDFRLGEWDYVILDEGHTIKNPKTKMSQAAQALRSKHRLLLTGTPIQNNLMELYTLVSWATNGTSLLGTKKDFNLKFVFPIEDGQNPNSTNTELEKSQHAARELRRILKRILLQVCQDTSIHLRTQEAQRKKTDFEDTLKLPEKTEVTVWIPLSKKQRELYVAYLRGSEMAAMLSNSIYPISAINYLKTLSRHPFLLEASEKIKLAKEGSSGELEVDSLTASLQTLEIRSTSSTFVGACERVVNGVLSRPKLTQFERMEAKIVEEKAEARTVHPTPQRAPPVTAPEPEPDGEEQIFEDSNVFGVVGRTPSTEELLQDSTKLSVCLQLIRLLRREDHRILVFSQSKFMLDIIQRVLAENGIGSSRIDGSICGKDRQRVIDAMNDMENGGVDVCLLTTRACGYGITLTGADRVIVFDPSWNPAEDRQAVDRAYRIGQTRDVVVYRFIMAGSLEQEMYKKEVFKDGLRVASERATNRNDQYFSDDPHKLFNLDQPLVMHDLLRREAAMDPSSPLLKYPEEIKNQRLTGVVGFTKHDVLYANTVRPEIIEVESPETSASSAVTTLPAPVSASDANAKCDVTRLEAEGSSSEESEESEKSCDSDSDSDGDLVDSDSSDSEEERADKYLRLRRVATREPLADEARVDLSKPQQQRKKASVVDLTGDSDDEQEATSASAVEEITDLVGQIAIQSRDREDEDEENEDEENLPVNTTVPVAAAAATVQSKDGPRLRSCGDKLKSAAELMRSGALPPAGLPSQCPMAPERAHEYDEAITQGRLLEAQEEPLAATKHYLSALSLCDADVELHRKLFDLKSQLGRRGVTAGR